MKTNENLWVSRPEAAQLCNLSPRHWSDAVGRHLPDDAVRGKGATLRYWAPAVVAFEVRRQLDMLTPDVPSDADMLAGPTTPALDRYRLAMAKLRELDLKDMQRDLVRSAALPLCAELVLPTFAAGIERMRQSHGDDAANAVAEMVADFADAFQRAVSGIAGEAK